MRDRLMLLVSHGHLCWCNWYVLDGLVLMMLHWHLLFRWIGKHGRRCEKRVSFFLRLEWLRQLEHWVGNPEVVECSLVLRRLGSLSGWRPLVEWSSVCVDVPRGDRNSVCSLLRGISKPLEVIFRRDPGYLMVKFMELGP